MELLRQTIKHLCSNLLSRAAQDPQHKRDQQAEATHRKPEENAQHLQGGPQKREAAEMGSVPPEVGELPALSSRKSCMEPFAAGTSLRTDSLCPVLHGNRDCADEALGQSSSQQQRASVPLVSSCGEAEAVAGCPSGRWGQTAPCVALSASSRYSMERRSHCWVLGQQDGAGWVGTAKLIAAAPSSLSWCCASLCPFRSLPQLLAWLCSRGSEGVSGASASWCCTTCLHCSDHCLGLQWAAP